MKKVLIAIALLVTSGAAYAGDVEAQRAAGELSGKTLADMPAVGAILPQPLPAVARNADEINYYETRCHMKNDETVGVLFNRSKELLHYNGKITFYYYDKYGELFDNEWTREFGTVWGGEWEVIKESGYPSNAAFCIMDARETITTGHVLISEIPLPRVSTPAEKDYKTSCRIENGEAVGVIRNLSSEAFRYGGSVSFYYYDNDGAMVDENLAMESGTIGVYASQRIINKGIPLRAESCLMDISAAVRK